jgi:ABC-2 type transport system ATP-binding protein
VPQVGLAIVADSLAKRYPSGTEAVRGISLRVEAGEMFGILGPNGAGKSTTMGILGTLVRPTTGNAIVAGSDVVKQPRESAGGSASRCRRSVSTSWRPAGSC